MTVDLNLLAQQITSELAKGDLARRSPTPVAGSPALMLAPPAPRGVSWAREQVRLAGIIDHTLLRPDAGQVDIERLCAEAQLHGFAAVCVNPVWVPLARSLLTVGGVKVATVVGFPLGANRPEVKAAEARVAVDQGADELDVVIALGALRAGDWAGVAADLAAVVRSAAGRIVKVIVEAGMLSPSELVRACAVARDVGAHYVKTATGFQPGAAPTTPDAVMLARLTVGDTMGVKASGGVRDAATALRLVAAGATRLGTSQGVALADVMGPGPRPLAELLAIPGRDVRAGAALHRADAGVTSDRESRGESARGVHGSVRTPATGTPTVSSFSTPTPAYAGGDIHAFATPPAERLHY